MFDLEVSYPPIKPPAHLLALTPEVYQHEQARVRERFDSAVELAEQAFATEHREFVADDPDASTILHERAGAVLVQLGSNR